MSSPLSPHLIAVDIGNTSASFHWYTDWDGDERPRSRAAHRGATKDFLAGNYLPTVLDALCQGAPPRQLSWLVASVHRGAESQLAAEVHASRPGDNYRKLLNRDIPMSVDVREPDRVGTDRLVAALAADRLRSADRPAIIIDAGSAITVDLLSADGVFQGGAILPGFQMAADALTNQTDALPEVDLDSVLAIPDVVGKHTVAAIQSGVVLGTVGAVKEIVSHLSALAPGAGVFVTGGFDGEPNWLRNDDWQYVEDLVPMGIVLAARNLSKSNG